MWLHAYRVQDEFVLVRAIQSRPSPSNSSKSENQFAVELIAGYNGQTNSR